MKKISSSILIVFLVAIISFFSLCYIFLSDRDFSENENRILQSFPSFNINKLLNGDFSRQLHNYLADQIALRDRMIELKALCEIAMGKQENNGILLCDDGYLIESCNYTDSNYKYLENNLLKIEALISNLEESGACAVSLIVPRKIDVLGDKLPLIYSTERNNMAWKHVGDKHISLIDEFTASQNVFYKTDHHWTNDGAYIAYRTLAEPLDFSPLPQKSFGEELLSNEFYGTSYSKSGFFFVAPDSILCPMVDIKKYKTEIVDTGRKLDGILDRNYLSKKDKYSVFLSGNNAHVRIKDTSNNGKETLLIIKDSYAHSLTPFLLEHYDIELIDPRYYSGSIEKYIAENRIKNVLFLFGLDTLATANLSIR